MCHHHRRGPQNQATRRQRNEILVLHEGFDFLSIARKHDIPAVGLPRFWQVGSRIIEQDSFVTSTMAKPS